MPLDLDWKNFYGDNNPYRSATPEPQGEPGSVLPVPDTTSSASEDGTHNMSRKTHCSRRHELIEPNLVPSELARGKRVCRACKLAHHAARSPELEFTQELADGFYTEVMQAAWIALRRPRGAHRRSVPGTTNNESEDE